MSDAPLMLGVSGLRGIVGESLTPELAVRYAGAFGTWLCERFGGNPRVLICRDGRAGGGMLLDAASAGLRAVGCEVWDCGIQTTPAAGVIGRERECHAAMIVTASHNPGEWNGLKCLVASEEGLHAPNAADAGEIVSRFRDGVLTYIDPEEIESRVIEEDKGESNVGLLHVTEVSEAVSLVGWGFRERFEGEQFRVVVDSVNASGANTAPVLGELLLGQWIQLNGSASGIFPHTPEPTAENLSGGGGLCDAVPGLKADVGFAQDPDADRLAIVDENGRYIGEEYTLALCALSLLSADRSRVREHADGAGTPPPQPSPARGGGSTDTVLCANLSTSRMIDDIAAAHGARVVRTPVGEANVVEAMKKLKAEGCDVVVGGEGNGGVIWPDVVYVRDSLGSMALVLGLMARTGKTVSQLVADIDQYTGGAPYAIVKTKQPLARKEDAQPVVEKIAASYEGQPGVMVDTQDGVRIDWPEKKAWVHVRASNTEPIMRLIAEAPGADEANKILEEVGSLVG